MIYNSFQFVFWEVPSDCMTTLLNFINWYLLLFLYHLFSWKCIEFFSSLSSSKRKEDHTSIKAKVRDLMSHIFKWDWYVPNLLIVVFHIFGCDPPSIPFLCLKLWSINIKKIWFGSFTLSTSNASSIWRDIWK